ncbi:LysR family transcriptional regulator [Glutamicibacter sp. 363]|uniref:LysR family transcriptional regulator n=1 Tax=unclassified Glutamicibacter TaxID=2627139 RepID=UPI0040332615
MATHLNSSNISLAQIAAVITVVDYGSFTAAADILGISQPSLSHRIRALEQTLGMPVFRAAGRNMLLTEAGRSIIPAGRRALREISSIDALASSTRSLDSGSLPESFRNISARSTAIIPGSKSKSSASRITNS